MKEIIKLHEITKIFEGLEVDTHAVSNINLTVYQGDYMAISGPSGCGKSTLLSLLGLLDKPSSGSYVLNGTDVTALNSSDRAAVRNQQIGFIFQSFNLINELTVYENIELPLTYRNNMSKQQRQEAVAKVLKRVEMEHRGSHFPWQLSGGQQQRVAVARALVGEPAILLADEPTGNLDSKNADTVMELLDSLHQEGSTICLVTHDPRSADKASRHVELLDGRLLKDSHSIAA